MTENNSYFLVLKYDGEYIFAPGRFAVYKNNDCTQRHGRGDSGTAYKRILKKIIGTPIDDPVSEQNFLSALGHLGYESSSKGRPRQYCIVNRDDSLEREIEEDQREIRDNPDLSPTEKAVLINARRGQGKFRDQVKARWRAACAVTACTQDELLRASHIKPWRQSTDEERLSPENGLFLSANLDALFDRYIISFRDNGEIIVSEMTSREDRVRIGIDTPLSLRLPLSERQKEFMRWHRCAARKNGTLKVRSDG